MSRGVSPTLLARRGHTDFGDIPTTARVDVVVGADPAAGEEFSATVPADEVWELVSVTAVLVQGLTDTPQPILVIDDGATVLAEMYGAAAAQAVSTTCRYTWAEGLPLGVVGSGANIRATAPLPGGLLLPAGYRVRSTTLGLAATGNFGAPALQIVRYTA